MHRALVLAFGLGLSAMAATAGWADVVVKSGVYSVKGKNFDGSSYSGSATITITSKTTCKIAWKTGDSGSVTSSGICMRDSDSFAAAYRMGDDVGLVIYKIMPDGSLDGVWTIAGENGAGTETLEPE